jgi:hypothetical protein
MPWLLQLLGRRKNSKAVGHRIVLGNFNVRPIAKTTVPPLAGERVRVAAEPIEGKPTSPDELSAVAEKLAHGLAEAWSGAVQEIRGILAVDHTRMEAAFSEMWRVTEQPKNISDELSDMRRRLAVLEQDVREVRHAQRSLEARLEVQAEVLRELHATVEGRAAQVGQLAASFGLLGAALQTSPPGLPLPEKL